MTLGKYLFLFAAVATFFSANVSAQTYDITDASWTSMNDQDGDGYTRSRVLHVVISASEPTFGVIRIYIYPAGGTPVVYYDTPGGSLVSAGNSYIDLQIGTSSTGGELDHGAYDIIVQLRSWPTTTTILAQRSGTSNLKNETFETAAQDVQAPLPSPPNLVSPSNGSNQSSTSINFAYQGVSGALEYWLQISRNSGFTDLFFDGSVGNYVIVSVNGFPNIGTVYYWRVRARNSTGWGSYSSAWSFTNGSAPIPVAPNLVSPPNGSYQALREINFAWQGVPGATEYWVQIAEDNSFTNLAYDNSVGNYVIVNISGFENDGKTYYWRARARNSGGWGPYSSTWWFINGSQVTIPVPPVLVAPLNNSMQDLTTINFAYQAVTGATEYWLQIATDNAFTDIVFDNSVGNFVIVALSGFPNDGTIFHWRVRARNSAGWGGYSDPWSFVNGSTPTITAISQQKASAGTNTSITISGSGFGATQGAGRVEFFYKSGNPKIPATVTSWSNTQIVCTVPIGTVGGYAASAGSGPITVTTDAGKTSAGYNFKITFGYGGYKWPGNNPAVSFKINENTPDCNGEGAAIQSAASTWNNAGAAFSFASNGSHTKTTASRNGVNEIMWGNASPYIAVATYWMTGSTMVEADIVFDEAGFTWSTAASPSASAMDVQTIAVHELGHWLCLRDLYGDIGDNDYDKSKVMYGFGSNGIIKRNLHADDVEGIKYIYGIPPVIPPSLSVTPVYRQVSAAAGSTTFSVKNLGGGTLTWTPEVNNTDWVSITSGNAGSNDGTIFVDYMANQGEARIGRIIVRGNAPESPISVEIRQDAPQSPVTHFTPVWSGSPYQAMNIFLESATYAGSPLSSGDEIGVYDGVLCVGAVRLSGAVSPYLEIKTSTDNPLTTPIDGFTSGHTITYKLWRSSSSTEVNNVTVTYNPASPIPTFTPLGTAFVNLLFSIVPPNIVITPPTLPGGMKNRLYSQAFSAAGGISPYIWSLEQGQLPSGLSLSTSGTLSGTPTVTGSYNFTIKAQDVASNYGTRQYTLVIADPLLISTSSPLPGGKVGTPYSVGLIASGGTPPYAWGLTDGTLPQGLTLSSGGVLSGRPIQATSSSFTISVTDKASFTTPKSFTLEVTDSLSITTASPLPEAQAKIQYSYRLNASGGKPPYVWSADRASMPDGFTLSSEGTLSGTNNYGGAFGPIVKVTDAQSDSVKKMFEFRINPAPLIFTSPSRLPDGMVNEPYAGGWSVSGGIGQFSWSIDSGAIPTGLQLSYRGFLFGTPRDTGTFIFKVTVRCSWDMSASQTDTLKIKKMHIAMAFPLPPSRVEEPYSYQFAAVDGSSPYSWRVASGNLPPGLTLSEGGLISGTPIVSGNFAARIEVKDSASRKDTAEIALTVYPMSLEIVTTSPLRCGMKGYAYLQHLEARGGMPPYTWSHYAGTLPRGLTVSPSGDLSGMLSDTGTFAFTIQLSDSRHATLTKSFSLTIHQALRMTNSLPLKYAMVNRGYDTKLSAEGGTAPYRWNLSGAAISQQITLSEDGGFSGTPSVAGIYSIKISLTDKENFLSESNCTFSIKEELQILAPGEMPVITSGAPIRLKFNARGGALPYRWSWSGQDMLPDLLISAEGELIGNPRRSGTFSFTVQVEDSALYRDSALCVLTINPEVIIPIDSHLPKGMVGERYALTIPHAGGTAPFTWSLSHGSLPDSITLSTEGALNGTPIVPGKYTFTLKISDAAGASTTKEFSLEITPPLKILTAALPEGMVEESYEDTLKAEGGMVPYMWSVKNGTLPEGISLLALGILRGSPVKADVRSFTLEVTDSVKHVVDQSFNFTVKNPCPVLHSLSDTIKSVGDETFTLVVHGAHFVSTSKILFDASPRQTTYMNASLLATQVMSAEMTVEDTLHITVVNDSPGGGVSTIRNLYIKGIAGVQVDRLPGMPRTFVVDQNYPNPFNPTTTIRFGVPSASYVTLTVFDALGRHVASLVSQDLSAGYYSVPFEALGKSSGIYLYRITALPRNGSAAKPFVQAKKLLLLR